MPLSEETTEDQVVEDDLQEGGIHHCKHWLSGGDCKYCGDHLLELYDLSKDLGETNDLSAQIPELAASLH